MRITSRHFPNRHVAGFTLVELLLILFILGSLALLTTAIVDGVDEQARYDDTKQRLALIKRAIVGDPTRTVNGEPEISGFVADMGRLPDCLRELLDGKCADADPEPTVWALDAQSGIWMGWRGPYLDTGTSNVFRDGWGNKNSDADEDNKNFGWQLSGELTITSLGKDNAPNGTDYNADQSIDIVNDDYMQNLATWGNFEVEFRNTGSVEISLASSLKLRAAINYPEDGGMPDWPANTTLRNASTFLSDEFSPDKNYILPASDGAINVLSAGTTTMTLSLPGEWDDTNKILSVQAGTEITFTGDVVGSFTISEKCVPDCKISITAPAPNPGHSQTSGPTNSLSLSGPVTVFVPPAIVTPVKLKVEGLAKVILSASGASFSGGTLTLPLSATISGIPAGSIWNDPKLVMPSVGGTVEVTVSEAFTLTGTQVVTSITNDVFTVPSGTSVESGNKLVLPATLPIPIGIRSLNIVCDDNGTNFFDGICPGDSTARDSTLQIKLAPRQVPPLKPNPLIWNIE